MTLKMSQKITLIYPNNKIYSKVTIIDIWKEKYQMVLVGPSDKYNHITPCTTASPKLKIIQ